MNSFTLAHLLKNVFKILASCFSTSSSFWFPSKPPSSLGDLIITVDDVLSLVDKVLGLENSDLAKDDVKLSVAKDYVTGAETKIDLPSSNVIKYYLNDNMWFVLRPSGTEPKLKVYYGVVGTSHNDADTKLNKLSEQVLAIVKSIE